MISEGSEINKFAQIRLILKAKFVDGYLNYYFCGLTRSREHIEILEFFAGESNEDSTTVLPFFSF